MKKVTYMLMLACLLQEAGHMLRFHGHVCHLHQEHVVWSQ